MEIALFIKCIYFLVNSVKFRIFVYLYIYIYSTFADKYVFFIAKL